MARDGHVDDLPSRAGGPGTRDPGGRRGPAGGAARRTVLIVAVAALVGVTGVVWASTVSRADGQDRNGSTTLAFDVSFSPQTLVATNNERDPSSPLALGDANLFHDQLSADGEPAGEQFGSCVIVALTPQVVGNCSLVVRLPDGDITGQFATSPGPDPKPLALTGGTGAYRGIGGEGTLVEFGNETGTLTLEVLFLGTGNG